MGSKIKEDERTEKAIRSLLKLPENRRCINCNSLGPQYVCSTFWTFVCTNCSGIHREFTHRVKSISMAKFTLEEVSALRTGGNEQARQIYFKEWDTQRDAYPDGSNIFKLRDFIKSVYVDKRYSSESNDKISKQKTDVLEDFTESKKTSTKFFGSRSLHSVDKPEFERPSAVGGSGNESLKFYFDDKKHKHQSVTHNQKSRGLPKSPIRFEIVDDRFRDDGSIKRYDGRRESRVSSKSLDLSNNKDMLRLPIVRHTSELLGQDAPHLRIENVVKVEENKDQDNNQMTTSPSNKVDNPGSLIDDVPASEPSACGSEHTPHSNENINQTSSELPASLKAAEDPAPNSLEALLFGLPVVPGTNNSELWNNNDISITANVPATNLGTQTISRIPENVTSFVTSPTISHVGSSSPTFFVNTDTKEISIPSVTTNNQVTSSTSPKGPSNICIEQSTLDISNSAHEVGLEHHHQDETKSNVRKALPEDLFTGDFSFASPQVYGQHHGMGYGMQYNYPVAMQAVTYTAKPANPFDLSCDDTSINQTLQFPSMAYMQGGGLPHVSAPRGFSDSSSPAADSIGLMASQSPFYPTTLSPNSPPLASNLSPDSYMGQQSHVTISSSFRRQDLNGLGTTDNTFNAAHTFHQASNGHPTANPNAYISRGNPFE